MSQHSILILDDEPRIRETLADFFSDMGCRVATAGRVEEALLALQSRRFTIAIVDMRLPDVDGITFISQARSIQPHLRCIVHTGSAECLAEGALAGAGDNIEAVLIKPVTDMNGFLDVLNRLPGDA